MMHRNSQWEDEVIDLENQVTHLLNQLEAVKDFKSYLIEKYGRASNQLIRAYWVISELDEILEVEQ